MDRYVGGKVTVDAGDVEVAVDVGGKVTVDREDVEVAVDGDGKLTVDDKDCLVPSIADMGCSVIGSARSITVKYGTDSRLLHTFIGLNHVIRVAYLLQHLW